MIKVIRNIEELDKFKGVWDNLYAIDNYATPFQHFDFIRLSLELSKTGTNSLNIIAIKDDAKKIWIAIFPFIVNKKGDVRYINDTHSDFCAPIIHPEFRHYNLFKELSEYIENDNKIKKLNLMNMKADCCMLSVLKPYFRYSICHDINNYPCLPISALNTDEDEIDSFRFIHSRQRKKLRKLKEKVLSDCNFEILSSTQGKPYPYQEVQGVSSKMISDGKRVRDYFSDSFMEFWEKLYEKGLLSVAVLKRGDEVLSCNFMFPDKKHKEYIKWLMLYTENQWNMVINILIAEHIYHSEDIEGINFARGIYDYKLTNFHPDVKALFCLRIAKTRWGHIRNMLAVAIHYAKPVVKSFLRR